MHHWLQSKVWIAGAVALAACTAQEETTEGDLISDGLEYKGVETRLLDDSLVNFIVTMKGTATEAEVDDYARCAAAQYALIRGFGFARHVRTRISKEDADWRGDAVYTVSAALPQGLKTIDAEVTIEDCAARGIPSI